MRGLLISRGGIVHAVRDCKPYARADIKVITISSEPSAQILPAISPHSGWEDECVLVRTISSHECYALLESIRRNIPLFECGSCIYTPSL
jgi:hypothetical protein